MCPSTQGNGIQSYAQSPHPCKKKYQNRSMKSSCAKATRQWGPQNQLEPLTDIWGCFRYGDENWNIVRHGCSDRYSRAMGNRYKLSESRILSPLSCKKTHLEMHLDRNTKRNPKKLTFGEDHKIGQTLTALLPLGWIRLRYCNRYRWWRSSVALSMSSNETCMRIATPISLSHRLDHTFGW